MNPTVEAHCNRTQFMAMDLINAILTRKEDVLQRLTAPNIIVTSILNGGDPKIIAGQEAYLAAIREIWDKVVETDGVFFEYRYFTETVGELTFAQVLKGRENQGVEKIQSLGVQRFNFDMNQITEIYVKEQREILALSAKSSLEKINPVTAAHQQALEQRRVVEDLQVRAEQGICAIL